jgi:hypothetical protein
MPSTTLPPWQSAGIEPKRKFKFMLILGDIPAWVIKTSGRPNFTVSDGGKHHFLAHEFKFPGRVTWDNVEVTLVDPIDFDASRKLLNIVRNAGYYSPSTWAGDNDNYRKSISKRKFVQGNLGTIQIQALNAEGVVAETWTLNNAWISKISQDGFDYNGEDLLGISLTLVYDWADLQINEDLVTIG